MISNIPDDKTVTYLTDTHKTGLASVQATDSCGGDVDITLSTSQSVNGGGYLLTKTWTAQDQCGNTASGQQAITASMGSQCMHSGSIVQHGWSGNSADHCKYYACNEGTLTTTQTICTTPTSISCLAPVAIPRDGHCCPTYRCAALVGVASHIVKINGDDTFEGDLHDCSKMHDRDMSSFYQLEPAVDGDLEIELDLGLVTNAINAYGIVFASPQFAYSTYNVFTSVDGVAWTLLHAEANGFCDDNISTKIRVDIAADGSDVRYIKFNVPNAVTDACHSSGIAKISDILIGIPDVSTFCDAGVTTCPTTECTGLGFTRTETLAANPAQGRCCPSYHCVQTFCASDTKLCWDGSTVTRDLADGCNFESCPSQVDCGTATTTCWDGSVVGKTTNDCIFECPVNPCDSLDCGANGECQPDTATCECEDAYEGTHCQMLKQPTPDLSHNTGSSFFAEQGVSCNTHTCYQMTDINEGWVEIIPGDLYTAGSRRLLLGDGEAYGKLVSSV